MPFARCPILFALATILIPGCVGTSPAVAMEDVEAIDIHLDTWGERQKAADTSTQDAGKIEGLLAVLRTAARGCDVLKLEPEVYVITPQVRHDNVDVLATWQKLNCVRPR